ncbi:SigE family RNA polymerase sigma factor [Jiangella sp. DSM 45060]|uniref:SigE family RNA polymerase sigma factor n=1 Tax=Jiangella sp. DSM 45060 TaxID=1798224 RepID=UPI00087B3323|nr:SigE family RNA polymerase sigma factor [Jiangella sp. DSM 45060]SDT23027.1 RNA polymerase sigma-70 factor, sigma-E family [Jiangella sp. DSM 45060]
MDVDAEAAAIALDRDSAFEQYVEVRQVRLLRLAYLLTGDQHAAEDLLQTTLAKLYLAWNRVERAGSVDAYTRRIMLNERSSRWRRAAQRFERSTDAVPERPVLDDFDHTLAERDALWSVVRELAPRQRATVVLRFYEDLGEQEIADLLGCSVGTVKSQTSRALATLRTRLAERKGDER